MNTFIYTLNDPDTLEIRYIGKSNHPKRRLTEHINEAKSGKSKTRKCNWINSILKKKKRPILEILIEVDITVFQQWEESAIKYFSNLGCKLTNSDSTGQGNKNRLKDINEKIISKLSKEVYQYDIYGNLINRFPSLREASRILKIDHSYIVKVCNKKQTQTNNFIFSYEKIIFDNINTFNKEEKKPIFQCEKSGKIINEFESIQEAARKTGFLSSNISKNCNNKIKTYKGYIFKFKN